MLQITLSYPCHACNDVFLSDLVLCKASTFPYLFSFDEPWSISDLGLNYDLRVICIRGNIGISPIWIYVWVVEFMHNMNKEKFGVLPILFASLGIHELAYELNHGF